MSDTKLFGKWGFSEINVSEEGLKKYISFRPVYVPNTSGRFTKRMFEKSKINIVERLINKLMRSGQGAKKFGGKYIRGGGNTGNKMNAMKVVKKAFEIIEEKEKKNPMQVFVDALVNAGPREETTVIIYGGIKYHQAIDVSPSRRVDFGLKNIALATFATAFNSKKTLEETLSNEIILASKNSKDSYAIARKEEVERIAESAR